LLIDLPIAVIHRDDASVLLEKKDKQIKELKEQLDSALKEQELADEEKLALGVDNEFLQRDHDELKEELEQLKKEQQEQIAAFMTQQQQLEQTRQQLRVQSQITKIPDTTHNTNNEEVEAVRLKLRQSYARMTQLEDQVAL
jgi:excinuclease UvrABC helicase subunit UvrB